MVFYYAYMIHETYNDQIRVYTLFDGKHIKPHFFEWGGRRYEINKVLNVNSRHDGRERIHSFSVSNNTDFFKLELHTENLHWYLTEHFQD